MIPAFLSVLMSCGIDGDVISNIKFTDGCPGNLSAIAVLCDGMTVDEIERKLQNVRCGRKRTSCGHQLSLAVRAAYEEITAKKEVQVTFFTGRGTSDYPALCVGFTVLSR